MPELTEDRLKNLYSILRSVGASIPTLIDETKPHISEFEPHLCRWLVGEIPDYSLAVKVIQLMTKYEYLQSEHLQAAIARHNADSLFPIGD
jgi:hypothetical protein